MLYAVRSRAESGARARGLAMASHCRKEHSETRYVYGMDGNRLTCPCTAPAVSHLTPTMPSLVGREDIPSCATMRFGTWQQAFSAKSAVTCRLSPPLYHCLVKLSLSTLTDPPTSLRMQDSTSVPAVFGATDSAARCLTCASSTPTHPLQDQLLWPANSSNTRRRSGDNTSNE